MKRRRIGAALALLLAVGVAGCFPLAAAAQENPDPGPAPKQGQVTQAELVKILVNVLNLGRFLPANPSYHDSVAILLRNRIAPPDGWDPEAVVTKGTLAVVMVKVLRAMGYVTDFDVDDSRAAIEYLSELGIEITTIGQSLAVAGPIPEPVQSQVFNATSDPLTKRDKFGEPDELDFGADAEFSASLRPDVAGEEPVTIQVIAAVIQAAAGRPRPPPPVTPDGKGP